MPASAAPIAIVGNLNVDQWIQPVERFPRWDEELLVDSVRLELAGTAGYILLAWRALGLPATVVSSVGDDAFGRFLLDEVRALGAPDTGISVIPGADSPLGIIFIGPGGERSIFALLGAHADLDLALVRGHDPEIARATEVFLCGSYLLPQLSPRDLLPYARELRARGQLVAFDPSWDPAGWTAETRAATEVLLADVDVYLPNDVELMHLTDTATWQAALDTVAGLPGETVLKRGAAGAVFASGSERIAVPGYPIDPVNTIGAGDVFDAAYLFARRQGWPPERRLRFACAFAAMVVSQPGARAYPNADAVERFMAGHAMAAAAPSSG